MNRQKVEELIEAWANGGLKDELLKGCAYDLNEVLGQYLYRTDKDERPDGALEFKDKLDSILSEHRVKVENARMEEQGIGQAAYSKHT